MKRRKVKMIEELTPDETWELQIDMRGKDDSNKDWKEEWKYFRDIILTPCKTCKHYKPSNEGTINGEYCMDERYSHIPKAYRRLISNWPAFGHTDPDTGEKEWSEDYYKMNRGECYDRDPSIPEETEYLDGEIADLIKDNECVVINGDIISIKDSVIWKSKVGSKRRKGKYISVENGVVGKAEIGSLDYIEEPDEDIDLIYQNNYQNDGKLAIRNVTKEEFLKLKKEVHNIYETALGNAVGWLRPGETYSSSYLFKYNPVMKEVGIFDVYHPENRLESFEDAGYYQKKQLREFYEEALNKLEYIRKAKRNECFTDIPRGACYA